MRRTLRGTPYFRDGDGARVLTALLRTAAVADASTAYVQGMNYVAAFALLVERGDADEGPTPDAAMRRAYSVVRGVTGRCRGYYERGFPTLKRDVALFGALLAAAVPDVAAKFDAHRVEPLTSSPGVRSLLKPPIDMPGSRSFGPMLRDR